MIAAAVAAGLAAATVLLAVAITNVVESFIRQPPPRHRA